MILNIFKSLITYCEYFVCGQGYFKRLPLDNYDNIIITLRDLNDLSYCFIAIMY